MRKAISKKVGAGGRFDIFLDSASGNDCRFLPSQSALRLFGCIIDKLNNHAVILTCVLRTGHGLPTISNAKFAT